MKIFFELVKNNPLFLGIDFCDFEKMFGCLSTRIQGYQKNDFILFSGDPVNFVGIILSGSAKITKDDINGNETIIAQLSASELFGEVFACAEVLHSPVNVIATDKSEVLFIDFKRIVAICSSACPFHTKLIENMLKLMAKKNLYLNQMNTLLAKRTTREKLLLFFDIQRGTAKKFTIPYNREELANYLCVDRSAMSKELCKMRDEGKLKFNKNNFELIY